MTIFEYGWKKNAVGYREDVRGRPVDIDESGSEKVGRGNTNPLGNRSGSSEDRSGASLKEADFLRFLCRVRSFYADEGSYAKPAEMS